MLTVVSKSQMIGQLVPSVMFLIFSFISLSCVKVYGYCKFFFIFQFFCLFYYFLCYVRCDNVDCVVACRFRPMSGFIFDDAG